MSLHRREFLARLSAFSLAATGYPLTRRFWRRPRFARYPFTLGVASGDPTPSGVVLWTRLAPDPLRGGGMPAENVAVEWQVLTDGPQAGVVRRGTAVAAPELAHSVHVEVDGLEPGRWYRYRFRAGDELSPIGRTRTTPAPGAGDRLRFAATSCQHYETGFYTAYRHMSEDDLDLVVHLGDYIYEYAGNVQRVRFHTGREVVSLDDYRNRYALYKTDVDLMAAHAALPWIVTWDDHEVDNNYAGEIPEDDQERGAFLRRRAAAYQAYYEHLPLRRTAIPRGPFAQIYRVVEYGSLASFFVLDTRQYRSNQPCDDRHGPACPGVAAPDATMLGAQQESWLADGLRRSRARWNVLAQQVMVAHVDHGRDAEQSISMDQWSGYDVPRGRLLRELRSHGPAKNPIVLTGDIHSNWVNDLPLDTREANSPVVATEFVATSISSEGDGRELWDRTPETLAKNPFVKYFNAQRGYVRCDVTSQQWRADFKIMEYVTQPGASIATKASFVVRAGAPGAEVA